MTQTTKISWTDFTVNFWEGCQKVGPGCDHCYAEARDNRFTGGKHWGPGAPRRKVKGGVAKLRKINRDGPAFRAENGRWPNVFCSSLADVFDNAVPPEWQAEAFAEMEAATDTRIQMLTKRVGNVQKMVPSLWINGGWPRHIGLMITVVNQTEADRDIPKLLDLKARFGIPWVGLSMEPLLGPVDLTLDGLVCLPCPNSVWMSQDMTTGAWECCSRCDHTGIGDEWGIDWVIVGGESGPHARPMHPDWLRSIRDQCAAAGVPQHFKQWGEYEVDEIGPEDARSASYPPGHVIFRKVGTKKSGRLLDGRTHDDMPEVG